MQNGVAPLVKAAEDAFSEEKPKGEQSCRKKSG